MEILNVRVNVNKDVDVSIEINDIIDGINSLEGKSYWNSVAFILRGIQGKAKLSELTEKEQLIVKSFLTAQLELFSKYEG